MSNSKEKLEPVSAWKQGKKKKDAVNIPAEIPRPASAHSNLDEDDSYASQKKRTLDPLTESLGQTSYIYKKRFEWLKEDMGFAKYHLDIERYYEPLKLCVDIKLTKEQEKKIPLKKQLCEKNGMQYFYCNTIDKLEDMLMRVRS